MTAALEISRISPSPFFPLPPTPERHSIFTALHGDTVLYSPGPPVGLAAALLSPVATCYVLGAELAERKCSIFEKPIRLTPRPIGDCVAVSWSSNLGP